MAETTVPELLRERASLQPDDSAVSFVDYDQDWDGVTTTLTWAQLYRRALNVARELRHTAAPGDRALILAPQGLEYVVGFLGALQGGLIPVPLAVPMGGATDERLDSVLGDAEPAAVLTTSAVAGHVAGQLAQSGQPIPALLEVDLIDLDGPARFDDDYTADYQQTAYLQYTSGSTRQPAGVTVSYKNLLTNFRQIVNDFLIEYGGVAPPDMTLVSWLPFYHDLGLVLGVCSPVLGGFNTVLSSPLAFLQRPARWMQLAATNSLVFTSAPNFAFDVAARKTSDEDMAGLDLGHVLAIQSGGERAHPQTLKRFTDRFARFNLRESVIIPSYGLAEATLYVARRRPGQPPKVIRFDPASISAGEPRPADADGGTALVSYGSQESPTSPLVRIADPETCREVPEGLVGEIWVNGDNVADGYWRKPEETARTFGARLVDPSPGTPEGPWLRTGDQGFVFEGELYIVGRIKDLLIVYGRNHAPDDIEATIHELTRSRSAAIAVPVDGTEQLVVVIEARRRGESDAAVNQELAALKREITSAISHSHGLGAADVVLVAPGAIPITTSGKVRRSACAEHYRRNEFVRLDA